MHPQFSTEFELKETIFENKYILRWNTHSVTLIREAILYHLPKTKDLSSTIRVIIKTSKRLFILMINAFREVFTWYHFTDRIKHQLMK